MDDHRMAHPHQDQHSDEKSESIEKDWEKKAQEYLDGWKRATADYQNLQKEIAKEKQEIIKYANANLILSLLPVVDHFAMARTAIPEDQKTAQWVLGIEHIYRQLLDLLKCEGITKMETAGTPFDPLQHEAVGTRKQEGIHGGQILEETRSGYEYHGKVIQPAQVIIAE
jgi:molecular chaperone GrpE